MADVYKVLAQSNPGAATLTTIYTTPASTSAIISSLTVANRSTIATAFRGAIAVAGTVDTLAQYIRYDKAIAGNASEDVVIGITLAATDEIRVYATLATLSFNLFGVEKT